MLRPSTGDAVLCDLGVGRITTGGAATATNAEGHGGTLLYFAPELLDDDAKAATSATDMQVGESAWCLRVLKRL